MAQAAMLINGAAATALIALLSKDKIDPHLFEAIPGSLWLYALGALLSWAGMFMMTECLDLFNKHWEEEATNKTSKWTTFKAHGTWWLYRALYVGSAVCFLWASYKLATVLLNVHPELQPCGPG